MEKPVLRGLKILFLIHFVSALVFGLTLYFYPRFWTNLIGIKLVTAEFYRLGGAAILAFGAGSWLGFRAKNWESVRILVIVEIAWTILASVDWLYYLLIRHYHPLYWLPAVLMILFGAAFSYFYIKNRA